MVAGLRTAKEVLDCARAHFAGGDAMRSFLSVIAIVALAMTVAQPAEPQSRTPAADALLNHADTQNINRPALAKLIANYCNEVLRVLPRNTPREDSWVDEETGSGIWDRIARAAQSVELARKSLVYSYSECALHSAKLTNLASPQPAAEAVLWTRLAMTFSNSVDEYAQRLGLLKYDDKSGWIDPHLFKSLPLLIAFKSHIAVIESLGQKL
jgi:hypothetical protein